MRACMAVCLSFCVYARVRVGVGLCACACACVQYVYVYVYVYVRAHWREEPKLEGGAHWEKGGRVE